MVISIALSWIISFSIWSPFIITWPYIHGKRIIDDDVCQVQFLSTNQYITLLTAFIAFFLPVTIICILYYKIWKETVRRQIDLRNLQAQSFSNGSKSKTNPLKVDTSDFKGGKKISSIEIFKRKIQNYDKSQLKSFFNNLLDNEEEDDREIDSDKSIEFHVPTERTKEDHEYYPNRGSSSKISKSSFEKFQNIPRLKSNRFFSIFDSSKFSCLLLILSRLRRNGSRNISKTPVDYTKCKIYYKSNFNKSHKNMNSKFYESQSEYSFHTIVIKLPSAKTELDIAQSGDSTIQKSVTMLSNDSIPIIPDDTLQIKEYSNILVQKTDDIINDSDRFSRILLKYSSLENIGEYLEIKEF